MLLYILTAGELYFHEITLKSMLGFINYQYLWFFALVPLLGVLFHFFFRRRRDRLAALGITLRSRHLHLLVTLPLSIISLFLFALARPYIGYEEYHTSLAGQDIMLVVDISKSMEATDNNPSRLAFAKRKIHDLIAYLEEQQSMDRVGIVLFAGESYLFAPLTSDYPVLRQFAREISTSLIGRGGSRINLAIETAIANLRNPAPDQGRILLLSDGEDSRLSIRSALSTLGDAGVTLDALGFGTREGSPIFVPDGYIHDRQGNLVITRLEEEPLQQLAEGTGGLYFTAQIGDEDIKQLFAPEAESRLDGSKQSQTLYTYHEVGPFLLWIPLSLFLLSLIFYKREALLTLLLLMAINLEGASAQEVSTGLKSSFSLRDAYSAYKNEDYQKARNIFEEHFRDNPDKNSVLQALASSEFKLGNFKRSTELFSELERRSSTGRDKFNALYNLGNSRLMEGEYEKAIENYKESLVIKEGDEKALHNLNVAKRLLEQQPPPSESAEDQEKEESEPGLEDKTEQTEKSSEKPQETDSTKDEEEELSSKESEDAQESKDESSSEKDEQDQNGDPDRKDAGAENERESEEGEFDPDKGGQPDSTEGKDQIEEDEAEAWLQSLPDSPLLIRRRPGGVNYQDEQQW